MRSRTRWRWPGPLARAWVAAAAMIAAAAFSAQALSPGEDYQPGLRWDPRAAGAYHRGRPVAGWCLEARADAPRYTLGGPVHARFVLRRVGDTTCWAYWTEFWEQHAVEVRSARGVAVPLTPRGRDLILGDGFPPFGGVKGFPCEPGDESAGTEDLNEVFHFRYPGPYRVVAQRWVLNTPGGKHLTVTSNELWIEIGPRAGEPKSDRPLDAAAFEMPPGFDTAQ